jgi:hypothetical protein
LASVVGLRVPTASVCSLNGELFGGVESVPRAQRNIRPWLRDVRRINNLTDLFSVIAADTWLANDDRNMGNVVGSSLGDGRIDVFMIDFEKSRTLAQNPFMGSGTLEPTRLWPRAELGQILRRIQPKSCPEPILERIKRMTPLQISDVVMPIAAELPFIGWYGASVEVLSRRAKNIVRLVEEVWKKN